MNQMTSQISSLKQAIGTLADAVSDELESFKRQFSVDLDLKVNACNRRCDSLEQNFSKFDNDNSKVLFELATVKDEVGTLQAIEGRRVETLKTHIEDKLIQMKSDSK